MREETKEEILRILYHVEKTFPCADLKGSHEAIVTLFEQELAHAIASAPLALPLPGAAPIL